MQQANKEAPDLEFSAKYDEQHAKRYFDKHENEFWRRISNWRDHQVARKALLAAGNPRTVLDVPCGTGRFWDLLAENPGRTIHACDYSQDMIDTGLKFRPPEIVKRIHSFQGSAFDLPVEDNFVECVFCIRLIHHVGEEADRLKLLNELKRVTSDSIIISLWVDGNYQAWKRMRSEQRRGKKKLQNRFLIPAATIEDEFERIGLKIEEKMDFLKFYSMWRTYVLRKS